MYLTIRIEKMTTYYYTSAINNPFFNSKMLCNLQKHNKLQISY